MLKKSLFPLLMIASLAVQSVPAADDTFTSSHFSGSGNCLMCHDNLTDNSGTEVSIIQDWKSSMMANSSKDPLWQAKVATELNRNAHLAPVINDKCSKCHAPMANYELTQVQGSALEILGTSGILNPNHSMHNAAMEGVSCTLCHQVKDDATLGTLSGFSGHYKINDTKTIYGQFSDIFGQPMVKHTGYTPTYSAHISDSTLCATCHNLKTPYVDEAGNVLTTTPESEFPEQMPYTEWQNSIYADTGSNPTSCQSCHMPKTTSKVSNRPMWLEAKEGFAKHHLVGANTVMLTMLRNNAEALGTAGADLDKGIDRARSMLQGSVTTEIVSAEVVDGVLEARVKLTNTAGHKAPTAYPSRRMWLHFTVADSSGNLLFESGRLNGDGSITGADNDTDGSALEPHYDLISSADEVQIYETIMGDSDGNITHTLLRAARYLKDNRLPPKGFDKNHVPDDVAVFGTAADDDNFNLGSDEITYRIPVAAGGELTVSVELNYQPLARGFVEDLYRDNQLPEVNAFKLLYEAQSLKHEVVSSAETVVAAGGSGATAPAPVVNLSASPATITQGESSTLSWSADNATGCTASGAWSGNMATSGSQLITPAATATYTLTCSGEGGNANDSATVTVNNAPSAAAPTLSFNAAPSSIQRGQSITLDWSSTDTSGCTASGDWSGSKPVSGNASFTLNDPATFTLTCNGEGGTVTDSVHYAAHGYRWLDLQ